MEDWYAILCSVKLDFQFALKSLATLFVGGSIACFLLGLNEIGWLFLTLALGLIVLRLYLRTRSP